MAVFTFFLCRNSSFTAFLRLRKHCIHCFRIVYNRKLIELGFSAAEKAEKWIRSNCI